MNKFSISLLILTAVVGFLLFFLVWINFILAPFHILLQALIISFLLNQKAFKVNLSTHRFALYASFTPVAFLLLQSFITIPLYITSKSSVMEIFVVLSLTFITCFFEYLIARWLFEKRKKQKIKTF
jgi:hypothetical protein